MPALPIVSVLAGKLDITDHQQVLCVVTLGCGREVEAACDDGRAVKQHHDLVVRDRHLGIDRNWDAGIGEIGRC